MQISPEDLTFISSIPHVAESLRLIKEDACSVDHRVVSFSGGKDSTALLGLFFLAKELKIIPDFSVINSDTRMEIPFLYSLINKHKEFCEENAINFNILLSPVENSFFYQLLGRGVAVPNRNMRWCTDRLKIKPALAFYARIRDENQTYFAYTGERLGESNNRDRKLKNKEGCGGENECGASEHDKASGDSLTKRVIVSWRTCQVWDFIFIAASMGLLPPVYEELKYLYSYNENEKGSLRTGCIGCPVIAKDKSLEAFTETNPHYKPLVEIRGIYEELRQPSSRLVRPKRNCPGAIKLQKREEALRKILSIQQEVQEKEPTFVLISEEEVSLVRDLIDKKTYPKSYTGLEPCASTLNKA
jgi:DNA sulfur modification protein DndC